MPKVKIKSRDGWVDCDILKENSKTYIVRIKTKTKIEELIKIKDGKEILKLKDVETINEIKVKKCKVEL